MGILFGGMEEIVYLCSTYFVRKRMFSINKTNNHGTEI